MNESKSQTSAKTVIVKVSVSIGSPSFAVVTLTSTVVAG
jgi:hypothetical protein